MFVFEGVAKASLANPDPVQIERGEVEEGREDREDEKFYDVFYTHR